MYVVQLFLPLERGDGSSTPAALFEKVKAELTGRFGGVTAQLQSPAEGAWTPDGEAVVHDRIVIFEAMAETLERDWWRAYRERLERELAQEQVLVRAWQVAQL